GSAGCSINRSSPASIISGVISISVSGFLAARPMGHGKSSPRRARQSLRLQQKNRRPVMGLSTYRACDVNDIYRITFLVTRNVSLEDEGGHDPTTDLRPLRAGAFGPERGEF